MKVILPILFSGLFTFTFAQSPFQEVHRKVVQKVQSPGDEKTYKLVTDGETLFVLSYKNTKEKGSFLITEYTQNLEFASSRTIEVKNSNQRKKFDTYRVNDAEIIGDSVYVLFSDELFLFTPHSEAARVIELPSDLSDLNRLGKTIILYQNDKSSTLKDEDYGKVYRLNSALEVVFVHQFSIEQKFFMHFQNRNYFETYEHGIAFMAPSSRYLELLDIESLEVSKIEIHEDEFWSKAKEKKVAQYNRLSNKDPHALFTLANRDLEKALSHNIRLDHIGKQRFMITFLPGQKKAERSFDMRQVIINSKLSEVSKSIEYRHQSARAYIGDREANTLQFNFFDHDKNTFCYIDGVRYQLVIEPHADWHNSDLDRINSEQEQSLLKDNFDLCIYYSKL